MALSVFATGGKMINITHPYPIYNGREKKKKKDKNNNKNFQLVTFPKYVSYSFLLDTVRYMKFLVFHRLLISSIWEEFHLTILYDPNIFTTSKAIGLNDTPGTGSCPYSFFS